MTTHPRIKLTLGLGLLAACGGSNEVPPTTTAQSSQTAATEANPARATKTTTLAAIGLDPAAMNRDADPCHNFYDFACGGWLDSTEIPADKARYGRFSEIRERNLDTLHDILEQARAGTLNHAVAPKIGAFYGACMNEQAINKAGAGPIKELLAVAKSVKDTESLDAAIASLHASAIPVVFQLGATPDFANTTRVIGSISQGGLGLPDREYYIKDDERSVQIRDAYRKHIATMLELSGMSKRAAQKATVDVLRIETALAKAWLSRVERRNPAKIYNKLDRGGVEALAPKFNWQGYFAHQGVPALKELTVDHPPFIKAFSTLRKTEKASAWRNYLSWHVVAATGHLLSKDFVNENFKLQQTLSGAKELPQRWKICVAATSEAVGELLTQPFLDKRFTPEAKEAADQMVDRITAAFGQVVRELDWMSDATKDQALDKLSTISPMFGYPDAWRPYDWEIEANAYADNALTSAAYERKRDLEKVGKPYDRSEWFMMPHDTNAYYNPLANQIVFPAGILQPPFFSAAAHVPVNLGAMGMIVGHELTHGFDDMGSQFDGKGNLRNWWAEDDLKSFQERGECVVEKYSRYHPLEDVSVNGKLTLGENIADIGGVKLAFAAYRQMVDNAPHALVADGYTEDQQFFLAVGQAWCAKAREDQRRMLVMTDPHSPERFRVIGALSNSDEFSEAFSCEEGTPMNPPETCSVW